MEQQQSTGGQGALLDLGAQEIHANWIDENQPLKIPDNPLQFKAHKIQVVLARIEKHLENSKTAQSFNASGYLQLLNEYTNLVEKIKKGNQSDDSVDEGDMAEGRDEAAASEVGERTAPGLHFGVSADNPLAG